MSEKEQQVEELRRRMAELEAEIRRLESEDGEAGPRAEERSIVVQGDAKGAILITGDGTRILASDADPELLTKAYLASLANECDLLPLGTIDTQFRDGGERRVRLPDVYVELDVTVASRPSADDGERDWAWRLVRGEAAGRMGVGAALLLWPWGKEFDPKLCNSNESEVGEPSPVGIFPGDSSPFGARDVVGNVWEWTSTAWGRSAMQADFAYPYDAGDSREDPATYAGRVLRGGSFFHDKRDARCAARLWLGPGLFDGYFGFRVVLSLAHSGS